MSATASAAAPITGAAGPLAPRSSRRDRSGVAKTSQAATPAMPSQAVPTTAGAAADTSPEAGCRARDRAGTRIGICIV